MIGFAFFLVHFGVGLLAWGMHQDSKRDDLMFAQWDKEDAEWEAEWDRIKKS